MGAPPAVAECISRATRDHKHHRSRIVVGDYILGPTLGEGATGKVKYAVHRHTRREVALKIIQKDLLRSKPAEAARFRREVAVLKVLAGAAAQACPKAQSTLPILTLLDAYETDALHILVLEYCPGGDMFERVATAGYFSNLEALEAFQQLVVALHFAHAQGVSHRDLKLENILIDASGTIKLADFGMASLITPGSLLETSCGTPCYCAPEVLAGGLYNGSVSDCWSLGVILYAMVTGGLPFDDDNFSRLLSQISAGIFFIPEEVHPDVAYLLTRMLTVNPSDRITLSEIMCSPWFNSHPLSPDLLPFCTDSTFTSLQPVFNHCSSLIPSSSQLPSYHLVDTIPTKSGALTQPHQQSNISPPPTPTTITHAPQALNCHIEHLSNPSTNSQGCNLSEPPKVLPVPSSSSRLQTQVQHAPHAGKAMSQPQFAIEDPDMVIVKHLTDLGLGELSTILRRLRSNRPCVEKQFYSRVLAYSALPNAPRLHALTGELPPSPPIETQFVENDMHPVASVENDVKSCDSIEQVHLPASVAAELSAFATSLSDTIV